MEGIRSSEMGFQNQQKVLTQQTQAIGDKGIAQTIQYNAAQQALQQEGAARQQNTQAQNQIGQAASGDNTALQMGMTQADMIKSMAAINMGNNSWQSASGDTQQQGFENKKLQQVAQDRQGLADATSNNANQLAYALNAAGQQKNLGTISADSLTNNSNNALNYAQSVGAANQLTIQQQQANQQLANTTAVNSLQGAASLDTLTNRANQVTATQGIQQQSNAAASQFGSQQAALQAQMASIHGANINQYAQLGLAAYQGYGLLSSQSSQPQQGGYSVGQGHLSPYNQSDLPGEPGGYTGNVSNSNTNYSGLLSGGNYG